MRLSVGSGAFLFSVGVNRPFMKWWGGESGGCVLRTLLETGSSSSPSKACPKSPTCFSRARKRMRKGGKMTSVTYLGTQKFFFYFKFLSIY